MQQRGKVRPIDDYKASLVNASVVQSEAVCVHSIDHIGGLCAWLLQQPCEKGFNDWSCKCWGLKDACKPSAFVRFGVSA